MGRTELFVGNLPRDVNRKEIEDVFDKYGRLLRCDIKNRGFSTAYAFLEFESEMDAEDALRAEHGKDMLGSAIVVEWAKSKDRRDRRDSSRDRYRGRDDRGGYRGDRDRGAPRSLECYECGERGHFARDCRNRRDSGRSRRDSRSRDRDSRRDHGRRYSRERDSGRRRHSRSASVNSDRGRSNHSERGRTKSRSRSPSYNRDRNDD